MAALAVAAVAILAAYLAAQAIRLRLARHKATTVAFLGVLAVAAAAVPVKREAPMLMVTVETEQHHPFPVAAQLTLAVVVAALKAPPYLQRPAVTVAAAQEQKVLQEPRARERRGLLIRAVAAAAAHGTPVLAQQAALASSSSNTLSPSNLS
jgi:hypothetical protein